MPSALRLLTTLTAEGPARHRAIAAWSAAGAAAGASGFVVGGIVTDLTSWRFIFWAYLPLAAALAAVIAASVPPDGPRRQAESLNLGGSAIFTAAVMAFVVGTTLISQPGGRGAGGLLLAACLGLVGGFVLADRRAAAPLLPLELIRSRWLRLGALGGLLNTATTSSVLTLVTLYLQNSLGRTPLQAAASLLPFSLAVIAASALAARVQRRLGPSRRVARRLIAAGLALIAIADAALIPLAAWAGAVGLRAAAAGVGIPDCPGSRRDWPRHQRGATLAGRRVRHHQHRGPARYRCGYRNAAPGDRGDRRSTRAGQARPCGSPGRSPPWLRRPARPGSPSAAGALAPVIRTTGRLGGTVRLAGQSGRAGRCGWAGEDSWACAAGCWLWTIRSRCGWSWKTIWPSSKN